MQHSFHSRSIYAYNQTLGGLAEMAQSLLYYAAVQVTPAAATQVVVELTAPTTS